MSKTSPTLGPIKVLYDLPQVTIRTRSVSEMDNNVYVITSKTTGSQVLIDAADDPDAIMELLESAADDTPCDLDLVSLITTHEHWTICVPSQKLCSVPRCLHRRVRLTPKRSNQPPVWLQKCICATVTRHSFQELSWTLSHCAVILPDQWHWCMCPMVMNPQ